MISRSRTALFSFFKLLMIRYHLPFSRFRFQLKSEEEIEAVKRRIEERMSDEEVRKKRRREENKLKLEKIRLEREETTDRQTRGDNTDEIKEQFEKRKALQEEQEKMKKEEL